MNLETWFDRATHRIAVDVAQVWSKHDAPRTIDTPMLLTVPHVASWVSAMTFEDRLDLLGRVETQALFGEPVIVIAESDGWCEVRLPMQPTAKDALGYPGWIRSDHLVPLAASRPAASTGVITERFAPTFHCDMGKLIGAISGGSLVEVISEQTNGLRVRAPHGECLVDATSLATNRGGPTAHATTFIGLAYLWSGLSGWGVDCSGLVHLTHRMSGVVVPRDSVDQFSAAVPNTVYFRHDRGKGRIHHVAFDLGSTSGEHLMLHAPRTGRVVEFLPITTPPYDHEKVWPEASGV